MSQPDPANPFQPPSGPPPFGPQQYASAHKVRPGGGMDYMRMITYVFENPNWMMTVLFAALIGLIPIIGPMVQQGYKYEVVIGLLSTGGARYPDFDFGRFADYLMRGLWPFLVALVASFALSPLWLLFMCAGLAGDDAGPIIAGVLSLAMIVIIPVFALVLQPMLLRAALSQDFVQGFQIEWIKDFLKRVWVEVILGVLCLVVASMVLVPLGFLACCIGIFAVGPILQLAHGNLLFQVYSLYLDRGGTPIPIRLSGQPGTPPPSTMPPGYPPKPL
jgi:hypothetical protein